MSGEAMQSMRLTTRRRRRDFHQEILPATGCCSLVALVAYVGETGCSGSVCVGGPGPRRVAVHSHPARRERRPTPTIRSSRRCSPSHRGVPQAQRCGLGRGEPQCLNPHRESPAPPYQLRAQCKPGGRQRWSPRPPIPALDTYDGGPEGSPLRIDVDISRPLRSADIEMHPQTAPLLLKVALGYDNTPPIPPTWSTDIGRGDSIRSQSVGPVPPTLSPIDSPPPMNCKLFARPGPSDKIGRTSALSTVTPRTTPLTLKPDVTRTSNWFVRSAASTGTGGLPETRLASPARPANPTTPAATGAVGKPT